MSQKKSYIIAVIVAALGYFVDIYDLLLFSIVRVSSLKGLNVPEDQMFSSGVLLINSQMAGLLIGGILWGVLGDKKGRLSVLFGSIFLYSAANIANGFVHTVEQYAILRFIAGIGLAGELGAGITLVCELMPTHIRGYGTTVVASIGILGAVAGGLIGDKFDWRIAYFIGGGMGLLLLALRVGVSESGMFNKIDRKKVSTGNVLILFSNAKTTIKYFRVILVGVPIWYVIGILVTFTPEFGKEFLMQELPTAGKAVMFSYLGLSLGDLSSGLLSQYLKSRKKVFLIFISILILSVISYFIFAKQSLQTYYFLCGVMGFAAGYWAIFVTVASEQFGTNIRSTVTTTAPNFVRGSVIPMTTTFHFFQQSMGIIPSALLVGGIAVSLALISLYSMEETFSKDLDFLEHHEI